MGQKWTIALLLSAGFLATACNEPRTAATNPYRIGLIVPLTSGVAASAQSVVEGAQLAVAGINAERGVAGRPLQLITVDDHGVSDEAARLLEQLVGQEVVGVVGPVTDRSTIAAAGAAARFKVVLITPGATGPLPYGGHFVFRTALSAGIQAGAMADYLVETLGLRRIAIIHDSNEYGTMVARGFEEAARLHGAAITSRRLYRDGDTEFSRHVTGALQERAQAIFLASYPDEGALLLRRIRAAAPGLIIAGGDALNSEDIVTWAGASADGLYVPTGFVSDSSLPVVRTFVEKYRATYKRLPDQFAAQSYDGVRLLAYAIRRSGGDRGKIRESIATVKRFPGVTGELSFDRWGEAGREIIIARVKGGAFTAVGSDK